MLLGSKPAPSLSQWSCDLLTMPSMLLMAAKDIVKCHYVSLLLSLSLSLFHFQPSEKLLHYLIRIHVLFLLFFMLMVFKKKKKSKSVKRRPLVFRYKYLHFILLHWLLNWALYSHGSNSALKGGCFTGIRNMNWFIPTEHFITLTSGNMSLS